jgi:hypothetical protein
MAAKQWRPVLVDTRGPFTAMILQGAGATATCLTGPSFTTSTRDAAQAGGSHHLSSIIVAESLPAGRSGVLQLSVMGFSRPSSGPISQASQMHLAAGGGQPFTLVQGQVEAGVTGATLVLSDGSDVQATVADGSLVAWWPGSAHATAARVTTGSATTRQQLTFTPLGDGAFGRGSTSSSSSR